MTRFKAFLCLVVCLVVYPAAAGAERLVVGERIDDVRETPHPYVGFGDVGSALDGPRLVWSETLQHPGAAFIAPHFARVELAPGDRLVVRSPDGKQSWVYEGQGKSLPGREPGFWSGHIKGATAIVELWAGGSTSAWGVRIDQFSRGLDDDEIVERNGGDTRAICGGDDTQEAVCFADSEPEVYEEARAVVRLLISGQFLCTGWLVGCEGHMMTNQHCITSQVDASNTDYEFMAEGASCATNCAGSLACGGTVEADSGTLIQVNSALDFALVELPGNLSETYGYMQLRQDGPVNDERIYIPQHPAGWGKRVGYFSGNGNDQSGFCEVSTVNAAPCSGGPGDVGYYCDTQGGSSGSPVLGYEDHRVVALHHCAFCPNRGVNIVDVIDSLGSNLPACSTLQLAGALDLDRSDVRCDDSIEIVLADDSLIGAGSYDVSVSSGTEIGPDQLTLSELSPGVFGGTLAVNAAATESGDGSITVGHGDVITVEYVDLDDGNGGAGVVLQRSALVDCIAPAITGVQVSGISGSTAGVAWSTDEPAVTALTYSPPAVVVVPGGSLATSHDVALSGLEPCTVHQFELSASDPAGNTTLDANAGGFYAFQTEFESRPPRDSGDTPLSIPDQAPAGVSSTITVAGDFPVLDVDVRVTIDHNFAGELGLLLFGPAGNVRLARRVGGSGDDYIDTWFDDDAPLSIVDGTPPFSGSFRPEQPLSTLMAGSPTGDWTLRVIDNGDGSVGQLLSWTLILERPEGSCSFASAPPAVSDGTDGAPPLQLDRLDVAGAALQASWGGGCSPINEKLIYGPLEQVGQYGISGSSCGVSSPVTLDALPGGDLWFLALGQNDDGAESSWGLSSQGERNGLASSSTCGAATKDMTAICP